jgi:hypothetical protein
MHKLSRDIEALGRMSPAELRSAWRETFKQAAPQLNPDLLARAIAYRLQERQHGGLTSSVKRELARLNRLIARTGECRPANFVSLKPGTRLVREWNGRALNVHVCDNGFELDGRQYASLTQIAHEVTGARWSGPRFFGLKSRKPPPSRSKKVGANG